MTYAPWLLLEIECLIHSHITPEMLIIAHDSQGAEITRELFKPGEEIVLFTKCRPVHSVTFVNSRGDRINTLDYEQPLVGPQVTIEVADWSGVNP